MDTKYHLERVKFSETLYEDNFSLPHRYVLIITNKCNLRCDFCFQRKKNIPGSLNVEDWESVIDQLPPYAWVTLTGGEPLFFKDFRRLFSYVSDRFPCNIISNGLLLNEELIDHLLEKENFKTLSISVDDTKNAIRGVKHNEWIQCEKKLKYFASHPVKKKFNTIFDTKTVVLDENAENLFDIFRYCTEELGADTHSFQFLKGSPLQHADFMSPIEKIFEPSFAVTYSKWKIILDQLEKVREYRPGDKRSYVHPKFINLRSNIKFEKKSVEYINNVRHDKNRFESCKAMWESVHINTEGEVFPCFAVSIGNIKHQTLNSIISSSINQRLRQVIKSEGSINACNRCGYLKPKSIA